MLSVRLFNTHNYFNLSDNNFIIKLHSGDERIFKEIFKKYYLPIRSFAWRFVKDNDIAEDIVQDCFLNVWEKRLTFSVIAEIRSYLYTSTRNACLDYLKHEQIKQKHAIHLLATVSQEEEQEYILEEEVDALIYQAIGTLSQQAQKMVIMTLNGDSNLEIAQKLNVTINTVKSTKLKAYQILRKRLRNVQWFLVLLI